MAMDTSHDRKWNRSVPRVAEIDTLTQSPPRLPTSATGPSGVIHWALVDDDHYEVRRGEDTIGFIHATGAVFVALAGARLDRAVEAAQTLEFEAALHVLVGPS